MKTQNRERQRKKQRWGSERKSDTIMPTAAPSKIWGTIKHFHPYINEVLIVVRTLNSIGANGVIISPAVYELFTTAKGCET